MLIIVIITKYTILY